MLDTLITPLSSHPGLRIPAVLVPAVLRLLRRRHDRRDLPNDLQPHLHRTAPARDRRVRQEDNRRPAAQLPAAVPAREYTSRRWLIFLLN